MRLRFLGTRGEIESRSARHRRHSSLLLAYRGCTILVDWGADWLADPPAPKARALFLTHAHRDHAGGLRRGAPWPVYATRETWSAIARYPIRHRYLVEPGKAVTVGRLRLVAFSLEHSLRAPAVGYRVAAGRSALFYAPDVVSIHHRDDALARVDLYVGDGASVTRPILRRRQGHLVGHASIRDQLDWCAAAGVRRAVFTHCGSEIVRRGEAAAASKVE
ncbi:MAG: MBL fold metallo-hydrolase, partial [Thermoanaerobaculia bacterium]